MTKQITATQFKIISRMKNGRWVSCSDLGCSIAILNSLAIKGIVEKNVPFGSKFYTQFRLLDKYRNIKLGDSYIVGD